MTHEEMEQVHPDIIAMYQKTGLGVVEKARLAQNFARYCLSHEVHWDYGKKRLKKDFSELRDMHLDSASDYYRKDDTLTLRYIVDGHFVFTFSFPLDDEMHERFENGTLSEAPGTMAGGTIGSAICT